jgi:predicted nucleic acid-binding protein
MLSVQLETAAKLFVQDCVRQGKIKLLWSYMLDYENSFNPYRERKETIDKWKKYAKLDVEETSQLIITAHELVNVGIASKDALHIACAIEGKAEFFLTTDKGILKKSSEIVQLKCINPVQFIETLENLVL